MRVACLEKGGSDYKITRMSPINLSYVAIDGKWVL